MSFQFSIFTGKWNFISFFEIVSATFFGLVTHIIKLFQTVQIQKDRFTFVSQIVPKIWKNLSCAKLLLRSIYIYRSILPGAR